MDYNKLPFDINDFQNSGQIVADMLKNMQSNYESDEDELIGVPEGEIDINDYVPADEEIEYGNYTGLINIFICYLKQLYCKKQSSTIFEGIDYTEETSTNRGMEFMYEEMFKFNNSVIEDKDILYDPNDENIDINNCDELYTLYIDGDPNYVCKFILPIIKKLSLMQWNEKNWSIIKIKG
jgi:hypothetical protein